MAVDLADLALHKPIRLARRGPGASDSVIYSGIASGDQLLHGYDLGTAEVTPAARKATADGLVGVKVVDPTAHQEWVRAQQAGRVYDEPTLGTVLAAELVDGQVTFQMAVHDRAAIERIDRGDWPDVSVAYQADLGAPSTDGADFAQTHRRVRHLALVPAGRDTQAYIVRDMADAGEPSMNLDELKKKHPEMVAKCRKALVNAIGLGFAAADAISLDKSIPLIKELMKDEVGKLVLHALVNAPAELREIEEGETMPMADAVARFDALTARVTAIEAAVKPIADRMAAADAAAADADLKTRAAQTAKALDNAGIARPEGFDPAKPTAASLADADRALVTGLAGSRPGARFSVTAKTGPTWDGSGKRTDNAADSKIHTSIDDL